MQVKGNAVAPKGLCVPFLGLGWPRRAGSGLKPKWVTADPAAGQSECFGDQTKHVGASHYVSSPSLVIPESRERSSTSGPLKKCCPFPH